MTLRPRRGLTLVEVIVVLSVLAILAGSLIPRLSNRISSTRDGLRLSDVQRVQAAIERFHADHGRYPEPNANASYGGWDVSNDGDFIPELVEAGYLPRAARDPLDDPRYFYAYCLYEKGAAACASEGRFYVLGVKTFETAAFAAREPGHFRCSERDWGAELAHVTGGGLAPTP